MRVFFSVSCFLRVFRTGMCLGKYVKMVCATSVVTCGFVTTGTYPTRSSILYFSFSLLLVPYMLLCSLAAFLLPLLLSLVVGLVGCRRATLSSGRATTGLRLPSRLCLDGEVGDVCMCVVWLLLISHYGVLCCDVVALVCDLCVCMCVLVLSVCVVYCFVCTRTDIIHACVCIVFVCAC